MHKSYRVPLTNITVAPTFMVERQVSVVVSLVRLLSIHLGCSNQTDNLSCNLLQTIVRYTSSQISHDLSVFEHHFVYNFIKVLVLPYNGSTFSMINQKCEENSHDAFVPDNSIGHFLS